MIKKYIAHSDLSHAGIKGQKWGIRRYQNEDGSLTEEGKLRYGKGGTHEKITTIEKDYHNVSTKAAKEGLKGVSDASKTADNALRTIGTNKSKAVNYKDYSKISDSELRARINRLNMERSYGELTGDTKRVRTGQDWTREVLQTVGAVAGIGATIAGTAYTISQLKMPGLDPSKKKGGKSK